MVIFSSTGAHMNERTLLNDGYICMTYNGFLSSCGADILNLLVPERPGPSFWKRPQKHARSKTKSLLITLALVATFWERNRPCAMGDRQTALNTWATWLSNLSLSRRYRNSNSFYLALARFGLLSQKKEKRYRNSKTIFYVHFTPEIYFCHIQSTNGRTGWRSRVWDNSPSSL